MTAAASALRRLGLRPLRTTRAARRADDEALALLTVHRGWAPVVRADDILAGGAVPASGGGVGVGLRPLLALGA